jgi:chemotaxis protein MotB
MAKIRTLIIDDSSAKVKAASEETFGRIASLLLQHAHRVRIEGHTDNVPIHTALFASNWELSTARATEVVRLLIVKYGFSPDRLSAAGYAEYHPLASNKAPEGRQQNRRVDIVILGKQKDASKPNLPAIAESAVQPAPPPIPATGSQEPPHQ